MKFKFNDGGRQAAGFKGSTGDCVCRAIAIAAEIPYKEAYNRLAEGNAGQRRGKREKVKGIHHSGKKTVTNGIYTNRKWFKDYMKELGFKWIPTMTIGSGCTVHLSPSELPPGRLVVMLSRHTSAVIDGVIHDTYDPSRNETRCVYGYYINEKAFTPGQLNRETELIAAHS